MRFGYIIGPFRANTPWDIEQNVRTAELLGFEVAKLGAFPVIPHANTRFFHKALPDVFWIEGTAGLLLRCDFGITVEALGKPWRQSLGSVNEVNIAVAKPMPVFHNLGDLGRWLHNQKGPVR
jgi:hypothetical protein